AYRWSSYGEAIGGGRKGNGKKAREGLVRACLSDEGIGYEAEKWQSVSRKYRTLMGVALERKRGKFSTEKRASHVSRGDFLPELKMSAMLRHRVRYFTDGAVIGGRNFVNEAFSLARERFGPKRK